MNDVAEGVRVHSADYRWIENHGCRIGRVDSAGVELSGARNIDGEWADGVRFFTGGNRVGEPRTEHRFVDRQLRNVVDVGEVNGVAAVVDGEGSRRARCWRAGGSPDSNYMGRRLSAAAAGLGHGAARPNGNTRARCRGERLAVIERDTGLAEALHN